MGTDKRRTLVGSASAVPSARPIPTNEPEPEAPVPEPGVAQGGSVGGDHPTGVAMVTAELRKRPWMGALLALPVLLLVLLVVGSSGGGDSDAAASTTTTEAPATSTTVADGPASAVNGDFEVVPGQRTLLVGAPDGAALYGRTWIAEAGSTLGTPATVWGDGADVTGHQWERCDPGQTNCEPIEDATDATYVVPALPSRTELRVLVEVDEKQLVIVSSAVQIP